MENPNVSVIIPVYNGEKTLKECLISVLNQDYKGYEIIVVDNNSADGTKAIIEKLAEDKPKIKYIFEEKMGRGSARNAGIKAAKGNLMLMIDADCIAPGNWISEIIKPIIEMGEKAVIGGEEDLINNFWTKNIQRANQELIKRNLKGNYIQHMDTKNFAIRAESIRRLMFDDNIGAIEDFDFYLRFKEEGKIFFLPNLKVKHNHSNSLKKWFKNQAERGYWVYSIYQKHKNKKGSQNEPLFGNFSIKNWLMFPFWTIFQFVKRPTGEAFFLFVSELGWKIGIIKGFLYYR